MQIDLNQYEYYVRPGFTDMRKGARSLAFIVQDEMELNPFTKAVFLFCGRNRKTIKAIIWDRNGWLEVSKRLECKNTFRWPDTAEQAEKITVFQLEALLRGNDVFRQFETLDEVNAI